MKHKHIRSTQEPQIMASIVTTRFNNETIGTNYAYRKKRNFACMYCSPSSLSLKIEYKTPVFVIEMNNETNQIAGIGLILNKSSTEKYYKVHADSNTNRYTYIGTYFMGRDILRDYNDKLVYYLEEILFKGYTHSKRGDGLTMFPKKFLNINNDCEINVSADIKNVFIDHFVKNARIIIV